MAARFQQVWATDASSAQIATAVAQERVRYLTAPAHASGLPDQSADLITVAQALHWFELKSFYAEVCRVLRPGGVLAVWTYGVFQVDCLDAGKVQELLNRFYRETVGPCWPPERRHVENGYAELPFPFREIQSPEFCMSVTWGLEDLAGYLRSWSATARYQELHCADPVGELLMELEPAWGAMGRRVAWPLSMKVGRID